MANQHAVQQVRGSRPIRINYNLLQMSAAERRRVFHQTSVLLNRYRGGRSHPVWKFILRPDDSAAFFSSFLHHSCCNHSDTHRSNEPISDFKSLCYDIADRHRVNATASRLHARKHSSSAQVLLWICRHKDVKNLPLRSDVTSCSASPSQTDIYECKDKVCRFPGGFCDASERGACVRVSAPTVSACCFAP